MAEITSEERRGRKKKVKTVDVIAEAQERLKGVQFTDDGERWQVFSVEYDEEHETPVVFYHDASLEDADVDDCEYSSLAEVEKWIKRDQKTSPKAPPKAPPKKVRRLRRSPSVESEESAKSSSAKSSSSEEIQPKKEAPRPKKLVVPKKAKPLPPKKEKKKDPLAAIHREASPPKQKKIMKKPSPRLEEPLPVSVEDRKRKATTSLVGPKMRFKYAGVPGAPPVSAAPAPKKDLTPTPGLSPNLMSPPAAPDSAEAQERLRKQRLARELLNRARSAHVLAQQQPYYQPPTVPLGGQEPRAYAAAQQQYRQQQQPTTTRDNPQDYGATQQQQQQNYYYQQQQQQQQQQQRQQQPPYAGGAAGAAPRYAAHPDDRRGPPQQQQQQQRGGYYDQQQQQQDYYYQQSQQPRGYHQSRGPPGRSPPLPQQRPPARLPAEDGLGLPRLGGGF